MTALENNSINKILSIPILGLFSWLSLLVFNPIFFSIEKLPGIREYLNSTFFLGLIYILIGSAAYILFKKIRKTAISIAMVLIFFWPLAQIELGLRLRPTKNQYETLNQSVPYVPAVFARSILPNGKHDVLYNDGSLRFKLRKGYHGSDFPIEKPEGETRIFIMGGSFVYSDFQPIDKSGEYRKNRNWVETTEQLLKEKGYKNVRLINAGTPGHRTHDSQGQLLSEIHWFNPDYVLLCHGWNDIKNFRTTTPENSLLRHYKPLPKATHIRPTGLYAILQSSQLFLRLELLFESINTKNQYKEIERFDNYMPYSREQFELNIKVFAKTCEVIGAKPILATQPRLIAADNNQIAKTRFENSNSMNLTSKGLLKAFHEIDSTVLHVADSLDIDFFDFEKDVSGRLELFQDVIHVNALGHDVIANKMANYLGELIKQDNHIN